MSSRKQNLHYARDLGGNEVVLELPSDMLPPTPRHPSASILPPISRHQSARRNSVAGSSVAGGSIRASTILSIENDYEQRQAAYVDWDSDGRHVTQLNDQQWVLQRKKIGLSRRTERSATKEKDSQKRKQSILKFLQSFKRNECVRYVRDPKRSRSHFKNDLSEDYTAWPCYCGAPEQEHKKRYVLKCK